MAYAYVKFTEDGIKRVVKTSDIKKFQEPVNYSKKYKVKYDDGQYYKAQILLIAETEDDVQKHIKDKRIKSQPSKLLETEDSESSDSNNNNELVKLTPLVTSKRSLLNANKENYKNILSICNNNSEADPKDDQISHLKTEILSLKKENGELKDKIMLLESSQLELQEKNNSFQEQILAEWKVLSEKLKTVINIKTNDDIQQPQNQNEIIPEVSFRLNGKVHLGRGVWLEEQLFDSLFAHSRTNSVFIRELATFIFGEKCLAESSVSGKACNKFGTPARPPLDATKLMAIKDTLKYKLVQEGRSEASITKELLKVNSTISQKITDLKRGSRINKKQTSEVRDQLAEPAQPAEPPQPAEPAQPTEPAQIVLFHNIDGDLNYLNKEATLINDETTNLDSDSTTSDSES